jgi:hypothetical protein
MEFSPEIERIRPEVLRKLNRWASSMADPDQPVIGMAGGEFLSPMDLIRDVEQRTPRGERFLRYWLDMALKLVMEGPTRGGESPAGPTSPLPLAMEMAPPPRPFTPETNSREESREPRE